MSSCRNGGRDVPEKPDRPFYLKKFFDPVVREDGSVLYVPKHQSVKQLGQPPWTLEAPDLGVIPQSCSDLVGAIEWRGMRFEKVDADE